MDYLPQVREYPDLIPQSGPHNGFKGKFLKLCFPYYFRDNLLYTLYAADQASFALDHRAVGYHLNKTAGK